MSSKLTIFINNEAVIEYDRTKLLPEKQQQYLDKMDVDMDSGFQLGDDQIDNPDDKDRAKFVAMNLIQAIEANTEPYIVAYCAYLALRQKGLTEVRADAQGEQYMVDLVYDQGEEVTFSKTLN